MTWANMTGPLGLGEPRLKSQRIYYVIALRSPGSAGQSASRAVASRARPHGRISIMLRWLTAGESHGRALVAPCEGVPPGGGTATPRIAAPPGRPRGGYRPGR